jgi:hypothetical protein
MGFGRCECLDGIRVGRNCWGLHMNYHILFMAFEVSLKTFLACEHAIYHYSLFLSS